MTARASQGSGRPAVVWHGTEAELLALVGAIQRNCVCRRLGAAEPVEWCASHRVLFAEQRAMDGLLFARHIASTLRAEEFGAGTPPSEGAGEGESPSRARG